MADVFLLECIDRHGFVEAIFRGRVEKDVFINRDTYSSSKLFVLHLWPYYVNVAIEDLLMPDDNEKAMNSFVSKCGIDALERLYNYNQDQ